MNELVELKISKSELELILNTLGKMPYEQSFMAIHNLQNQYAKQFNEQKQEESTED